MKMKSNTTIIGAGLAGIVAALELLDRGISVSLVDRDEIGNLGGLAKKSFGGIFMVGTPTQKRTGIKDSTSLALSDWCSTARFGEEDVYPKKWAELYIENSIEDIYTYLIGKGIQFFPVVHWVERGLFHPGNSVPRFHMVWGTGHVLAVTLVNHLLNHKNRGLLTILNGTRIRSLEYKNSSVSGCHGVNEVSGEEVFIESEHIIIASGGVAGDINQVKKNWPEEMGQPPQKILNGSHPFAIGDLHSECSKLGGKITHLDKMWNYAAGVHHPKPTLNDHGISLVPPRSAIWLNSYGKRIGPVPLITGFDTRFLVQEVSQQEDKYSWQILNWKIAIKELAVSGSEFNEDIKNKKIIPFLANLVFGNKKLVNNLTKNCIDFVTSDSLKGLVEKMNQLNGDTKIKLENVETAVGLYDSMIDRGKKFYNDDQLRRIEHLRLYRGDRIRISKNQKILDSKSMPLIAIREFILSRKSMGGIQTNLHSEVLNQDGMTIKGLYAIGEAAGFGGGGIHGKASLEGTFLGSCILTAKQAARRIGSHESDKR